MKKIVGTILAAGLALTAFAAEPAANFVMAEFNGKARFGFEADFAKKPDAEFGMYNGTEANLKLGFVTPGDKATTGDGIWGELGIQFEKPLEWNMTDAGIGSPSAEKTPAVSTAKIHFVDGDFSAALNILAPNLDYGDISSPSATGTPIKTTGINATGDLTNGLVLEVSMKDMFGLNVRFMDNGKASAKNKQFGLGFDAALNAVPNLTANVKGAFNFKTNYTGIGAELAYNLVITDALYVKPGVGFSMIKENADAGLANYLEAGVLLGCGKSGLKPELDFVNHDSDAFAEGVSVAVGTALKENTLKLVVGGYYESLFDVLGLSDFGTLKLGAQYVMEQAANDVLAVAAKYHIDLSPVYFDLHGGMELTMPEAGDATTKYAVGVELGSGEIIDNTNVFVSYNLAGDTSITTNFLKIGTEIHF